MVAEKSRCIVCGSGDTGVCVVRELLKHGFKTVVIDEDMDALKSIKEEYLEVTVVNDDCLKEDVLMQNGIKDAGALFAVLPDDRMNVFLSLTVKRLNSDLNIYSRAVDISAKRKLELMGVDKTIIPNVAEGSRISNMMLRPKVVEFIDSLLYSETDGEGYLEVLLPKGSPSSLHRIDDLHLTERTGVVIIAIRRRTGRIVYNPKRNYVVHAGDALIGFGTEDDRLQIEKILSDGPGEIKLSILEKIRRKFGRGDWI